MVRIFLALHGLHTTLILSIIAIVAQFITGNRRMNKATCELMTDCLVPGIADKADKHFNKPPFVA